MIPATYPSTVDAVTGRREMVMFNLASIAGLTRWTDYIPVVTQVSGVEGKTDANGYIAENRLVSATWFIPVAPSGT